MRYAYFLLIIAGIGILVLLLQNQTEEENPLWLSYEEALNESNKTGKMLFVFISSPTCPICKEFKNFFNEDGVLERIAEKYVPVHIKDPANSPILVTSFPTFCIGYPGNLECFYAPKESLLKRLGVG